MIKNPSKGTLLTTSSLKMISLLEAMK